MPIDAAVPSTTEISVVQIATTRLFQAARCIWSASSSAEYQRKEKPGGGNFSDSDEVSDVIRTMTVGAIRKHHGEDRRGGEHDPQRGRLPVDGVPRGGHRSRSCARARRECRR